jgi:hypothetical protein
MGIVQADFKKVDAGMAAIVATPRSVPFLPRII